MLFFQRNARSVGPTSSAHQNAMMNEIAHDLANIISQLNNTIVPLTNTIPDGTQDINVNAFVDGLDARTLYVDSSATSSTNPNYCLGGTGRPVTVYEEFQYLNSALTSINSLILATSGFDSPFTFYNGKVGLDNVIPSWPFAFGATTGNKIALYDLGGGLGAGFGMGDNDTLEIRGLDTGTIAFGVGGNNDMTKYVVIDQLGKVGIGEATPSAVLSVYSSPTLGSATAFKLASNYSGNNNLIINPFITDTHFSYRYGTEFLVSGVRRLTIGGKGSLIIGDLGGYINRGDFNSDSQIVLPLKTLGAGTWYDTSKEDAASIYYVTAPNFIYTGNNGRCLDIRAGCAGTNGTSGSWIRFLTQQADPDNSPSPVLTISPYRTVGINLPYEAPVAALDANGFNIGYSSLQLRSGVTYPVTAPASGIQVAFSYHGIAEYRHNIRTRHAYTQTLGNAIDFYVWNYGIDGYYDFGSLHTMSLNNGNVGVGILDPGYKLEVSGNTVSGYVSSFWNNGNSLNRHGIKIRAGAYSNDVGQTKFISCWDGDNANEVGYIEHSTGGVFRLVDPSDATLKENIGPTDVVGLAVIEALPVRKFDWRDSQTPHNRCGFIAQEVEGAFPEMVSYNDSTGLKGVSKEALVPVLVKAIQELVATVSGLNARITALEG